MKKILRFKKLVPGPLFILVDEELSDSEYYLDTELIDFSVRGTLLFGSELRIKYVYALPYDFLNGKLQP